MYVSPEFSQIRSTWSQYIANEKPVQKRVQKSTNHTSFALPAEEQINQMCTYMLASPHFTQAKR